MTIELEGPETVFADDAVPLLRRINELEKSGGHVGQLSEARLHVAAALVLVDEVFARLR